MNNEKHIEELVNRFVKEESGVISNPFMATRIMAAIDNKRRPAVKIAPVWRAAMAAFVLALAVFAGVAAGNLYNEGAAYNNTVLINDDAMEHFGFYTAVADE
jgi:Na+/proline symporter